VARGSSTGLLFKIIESAAKLFLTNDVVTG
jgi:hypothetical protein